MPPLARALPRHDPLLHSYLLTVPVSEVPKFRYYIDLKVFPCSDCTKKIGLIICL